MDLMNFVTKCAAFGLRLPGLVMLKIEERQKRKNCVAAPSATLFSSCRINNGRAPDCIRIGANTQILGNLQVLPSGGMITIGDDCFLGEGSYVWSTSSIRIGNRVLISHGVNIHDNNSHSLSARRRHRQYMDITSTGHPTYIEDIKSAAVVIEDDVWIGFNSTILKGVTIGRGAVVGASSVVNRDVAPYCIVVGNPAKVVGQAEP